jgi:hypothetical protein
VGTRDNSSGYVVGVAACLACQRRGPFIAGYAMEELSKLGIASVFYPTGAFPDPRLWLARTRYNVAEFVLSVSQGVDRAVARVFGETGQRREILDILEVYGRDGRFDEVSFRILLAYESLRRGREGVERIMARPEVAEKLDLGQVLEMRGWKGLVLRK